MQSQTPYQKGKAQFIIGDYTAALETLIHVKEAEPDLNYLIAMSYFNLKKFDLAIPYFEKEISVNRNNLNAYIQKSNAEHLTGNDKQAQESLKQALAINPDYYIAYFQLGELKYDNKDYSSASADYQKAIELHPHFENAFYKLGFCFYKMNNNNKACEWWSKIEDPDDFKEFQLIERLCK